jgi:hypothetical protein
LYFTQYFPCYPDKYSGGRNDRSNEYHTDSNVDISESRQGNRYRGGNYRGQGKQYERRDNRDISKKDLGRSQQDSSNNIQNTYHSGSDRNSKDRNKQYSVGGRGSPRQIDIKHPFNVSKTYGMIDVVLNGSLPI